MRALLILVFAMMLCVVDDGIAAAQSPGAANGHGQPSTMNSVAPLTMSTVSGLPVCNGPHKGLLYVATDVTPVTLGSTAVSGGTAVALVLCNGTNWTVR